MAFTAKITGVDAILRKIQQAPEKVAKESEKIINDSVEEISRAAKARVPVSALNKVHLKDTIGFTHYTSGVGASVYASAYYAPYVEFGTGDSFQIPVYSNVNMNDLEEYAASFKRRKRALLGVPHRPFLFNSYSEVLGKMVNRIKKIKI
jgi:HK97 gp10 family phage protein